MERGNKISNFDEKYALEIFSSDAYFTVNKKLLCYYGPEVAIFLSNLIDKFKFFKAKEIISDNWFYITYEDQSKQTGLTLSKLRTCKTLLIEENILEIKRKGLPAKEWYKLNLNIVCQVLRFREDKSSGSQEDYNIINNINNKTIPPTEEEVLKYCQERKNNVDPESFIDFYQSKGWFVGKNKMKDWKAAIRTWEKNHNTNTPKSFKCPDGRKFGEEFNDSRQGCWDCETYRANVYHACQSLHNTLKKK